jgi:hypothetical protein
MNKTKLILVTIISIIVICLLQPGCSNRIESPVVLADSTIVYPSKSDDGISAGITLCKSISKKTGKLIGAGTTFTIREEASVRAVIDLENIFKSNDRPLMFHVDWVDKDDNSIFFKRIDLAKEDTVTSLISSISITPDKREPGEYTFRVYLFRELIAEKSFQLRAEYQYTISDLDNVLKKLTLCRSIDKTTGEIIGEDSVFIIKEKARVRGIAEFQNLEVFGDRELKFFFDWVDSIGTLINRKELDLTSGDSSLSLSSFIPISPDVQKPGKFKLRLLLFENLIAEKKFELRNEPKITITKAKGVKANIEFCKSINKKTGERKDVNTVFIIGEKEKVYAFVELEKQDFSKDQTLKFRVDWIGPNGKSFYKKQIDLQPDDSSFTLNSSISISPETRKPGKYIFRIYLVNDLVAEKEFELR